MFPGKDQYTTRIDRDAFETIPGAVMHEAECNFCGETKRSPRKEIMQSKIQYHISKECDEV